MIRNHKFIDKVYRLFDQKTIRTDDLGECDFQKHILRIPFDGDTKDDLDTIIHEAVHACCPWMKEWMVVAIAKSISSLLWRLKWRKEDELKV